MPLVPADVGGAKDPRPIARRVEYVAIEALLPLALRQRRGDQELKLGAEQSDAARAGQVERRDILTQSRVYHQFDGDAVAGDSGQVAQGGEVGAAFLGDIELGVEGGSEGRRGGKGGVRKWRFGLV